MVTLIQKNEKKDVTLFLIFKNYSLGMRWIAVSAWVSRRLRAQ
jgi:hypothetical protein